MSTVLLKSTEQPVVVLTALTLIIISVSRSPVEIVKSESIPSVEEPMLESSASFCN